MARTGKLILRSLEEANRNNNKLDRASLSGYFELIQKLTIKQKTNTAGEIKL